MTIVNLYFICRCLAVRRRCPLVLLKRSRNGGPNRRRLPGCGRPLRRRRCRAPRQWSRCSVGLRQLRELLGGRRASGGGQRPGLGAGDSRDGLVGCRCRCLATVACLLLTGCERLCGALRLPFPAPAAAYDRLAWRRGAGEGWPSVDCAARTRDWGSRQKGYESDDEAGESKWQKQPCLRTPYKVRV